MISRLGNPETRYGRDKAKRVAQERANKVGRKVYLQVLDGCHVLAADGRGPININVPWREFYPEVRK